jgi:hypothetical protein
VVASQNFTTGPEVDEVGHGTHVASIIAGSGAAEGGRYRGVAPGAQLLSGKVCEIFGCPESSILAGMQWAVVDQGARLVNFSIGGMDEPGIDPLEAAIDSLSADFGALFVVAAGNAGDTPQSVSSPGTATLALSVGAVDRSDEVAEFSGRGLSVGSYAVKPELTAPGVGIVAARAQGTLLGLPVGDAYVSLSGTSMATPHVAGAAALLLQQHPEWGARELKAALIGSSQNSPAWGVADQGAGRVDIEAALDLNLFVDPPSTSFGIASWPHEDDEPVERTLTYQNLGGAIDLSFELDVKGPDGVRPPAEMFSVTPATLHIPAGETATVTVTARTSVAGPNGTYGGRLLASDGAGRTVATPLAVYRETESYDLTIRHIGRDDQPADYYFFLMVGLDQFYVDFFFGTPGEDVTRRVPGGRYTAGTNFGAINSPDPWAYVILAVPELSLDEDRLLELDGRVTEPISLRAPTRRADLAGAGLSWFMHGDVYGLANSYWFLEELDPLYYSATIGPVPPEFVSFVHAEWTDTTQTPSALYAAAWVGKEGLPQEPLARITKQSTAVVDASYAASLTESPVWNDLSLLSFVRDVGGGLTFLADLPLRRTEHYFSDDSATTWMTELWIHDPAYATNLIYGFEPRSLRPGKRYRSHWNQPPFSVHLSEELQAPYTAASRAGDVIAIAAATYSDNEQHAGYIAAQGTTSLYRNGELIGFSDYGGGGNFDVPPEPAEYRLELEEAQGAFELSTQQQTVWSFESSHADGEERLPLLVVHFDPELDDRGRAPRGRDFTLPLSVQQYGQSGTPRVRRPKLEVSFDDGVTWTRANVERDGHNWRAEYEHPRHGDYVSLRVSTLDGEGNAVEQTLIRAYALAERRGGH